MTRRLDDAFELRESLRRNRRSVLDTPKEVELELGPGWEFGRLGIVKGFPQFEESDLPVALMPGASFRKIPFDFPEDNLRGFAAVLTYKPGAADYVPEALAGWVPPEREQELDEWIAFLNRDIEAGLAAEAARLASFRR